MFYPPKWARVSPWLGVPGYQTLVHRCQAPKGWPHQTPPVRPLIITEKACSPAAPTTMATGIAARRRPSMGPGTPSTCQYRPRTSPPEGSGPDATAAIDHGPQRCSTAPKPARPPVHSSGLPARDALAANAQTQGL